MTDSSRAERIPTESLCPVCLRRVPALRVSIGPAVFLEKTCGEHGRFRTVIWRGPPDMAGWVRPKHPSPPRAGRPSTERGCPFDCGLCIRHGQHTCTALLEVTGRCNLACPICFASSNASAAGGVADPDARTVHFWYERVMDQSGPCNIQLSGGEPTVRDDLPDLVAMGRRTGFPFIQLNTNGIRLAREPSYARRLREAGLASVFLQFDGTDDSVYRTLRGRSLLDEKRRAVERCAEAGIGVVLTATLMPGVNTGHIGSIIDLGIALSPAVRGIHFQPVAYFGRYPHPPDDALRITLPEVIVAVIAQGGGRFRAEDFHPPGCEHALCSFSGNFIVLERGRVQPLTRRQDDCCAEPIDAAEGARKAIAATAARWAPPAPDAGPCACGGDDLDRFIGRASTHSFSISCMAFQDAWTVDLERLRGCCIHTVSPDGRLIPFCAYNLTDCKGRPLHRKTDEATPW
ncbi:radical SAM (seleno)protein TrsS [Desulfococcus sp.]|uniref:radical SAM (seleno)protein TrsS n=1 Tax=Desulfococcus sp. TaxID=2025834 RepID=UPI003593B60C